MNFGIIDARFKSTYCVKCNKIKEYCTNKKEKSCSKCKSVLKYGCGKCKKLFKTIASLETHLTQLCNKEPKHWCSYCNYKTHHKPNLNRHIQAKH